MAQRKKKNQPAKKSFAARFQLTRLQEVVLGSALMALGLLLFFSFISFLFTWRADQSTLQAISDREIAAQNWISKLGAFLGDFFVYDGFGIASFSIAILLFITGFFLFVSRDFAFTLSRKRTLKIWFYGLIVMLWFSIALGFFHDSSPLLSGKVGFELNDYLQDYIGVLGVIVLLVFTAIAYLVVRFRITPERVMAKYRQWFPPADPQRSTVAIEHTDKESQSSEPEIKNEPTTEETTESANRLDLRN